MRQSINWPSLIGGGFFLGLALAGLWLNHPNDIGTARRMGPGYLPMLAFLAMAAIAAVIIVVGCLRESPRPEPIQWRSLATILSAVGLFGILIETLGLAAAIAASTLLASASSGEVRPMRVAGLAAFLTALCWVVFVYLLGIGIALFPVSG